MSYFQNAQNLDMRFSTFNLYLHTTCCPCHQSSEATAGHNRERNKYTGNFPENTGGWKDDYIYPCGWKYLRSAGLITDSEWRAIQPLPLDILTRQLDKDCDEVLRPSLGSATHSVTTYMNHASWYASLDKDAVTRTDYGLEEVYDLRIAYWYLMYRYMSHISLRRGAEKAARESLNVYIMEGLRLRSESRAPFSLEECRKLLKWLDHPEKGKTDIIMLSPSGQLLSQSSARTLVISWILLHVAYHSKAIKYGLKTKSQAASMHYGDSLRDPFR